MRQATNGLQKPNDALESALATHRNRQLRVVETKTPAIQKATFEWDAPPQRYRARLRGIISLDMSVAIHWMPLVASTEQSVSDIGKVLLMAGQSDCFQRTHCPEMPLHYRTANGGPDVSDHRARRIRRSSSHVPIVQAIYRAIRTAIRDGPYSTDDLSRACLFVPCTDISCWCADCMHGTYSGNIESMHPVSAAIERHLSS
ncbi:hypothetical protein PTSG_13001 [Salpingoeca rosetta]|uniref:Uncharacterized protein n=1 Tax=Salpingoeca rosetta (strain ATCC 50818 / BSB-021) TaxID=946362 RepID=F2UQD1_SALR5|nr:uncharacterized protein PTSG_13001 [Salpingoeca rosetta]EGD79836.1 hypothetical protein PTSG_13001 [Salpingoeca rosetta]|eukprot:XP_004988457.1 hypothetical protein PTSG_13001 [Salpingoeca rosetta]